MAISSSPSIGERVRRIVFPLIPQWVLHRFFGWQEPVSGNPPMPTPLNAARRLVFGPQDEVGQATEWCRALDTNLSGIASLSVGKEGADAYAFSGDYLVPNDIYYWSRRWQRDFRRYVLSTATHVIVESGYRLFGNGAVGGALGEFRDFERLGIVAGHLFHGSDIRVPAIHREETEWSPFADPDWQLGQRLESLSQLNRRLIEQTGAPVFVSTPDLLSHVEDATWLPLVAPQKFASEPRRRNANARLRVVHAPSSAYLKGSELVEPTLLELDERGLIEYRRVRDVPHAQMLGVYRGADVVLDQFRIGSYGLSAVEAMAASRVVVGHVTEATRARVREETGLELPVLEADARSLRDLLERILEGAINLDEVGEAGAVFTSAVHDGRLSSSRLERFLHLSEER